MLAKLILCLTYLLPDFLFRRRKYLFCLLTRLLQGLCAKVLAQAYPQFLFDFRGNMCQRNVELAALGLCLCQLLPELYHFRLQRRNQFADYGFQLAVGRWRISHALLCVRRGYLRQSCPIFRTPFQSPEIIRLIQHSAQLPRSEEHTSELQSPIDISYAVF